MVASRFRERIGAVAMPEAVGVIGRERPDRPGPGLTPPTGPGFEAPFDPRHVAGHADLRDEVLARFCLTELTEGCYRLDFTPSTTSTFGRLSLFGTRYRGTLRVERVGSGYRISGDLYRYSLLDILMIREVGDLRLLSSDEPASADAAADDDDSVIPIYKRRDYYSYLEGKSAFMWSFGTCSFLLTFDEWTYNHPATGFNGSFDNSPARSVRFAFRETDTDDLYTGDAFEGNTKIGTVSIRHVSPYFRRATLQVDTLEGAETPPKSVPGPLVIGELARSDLLSSGALAGSDLARIADWRLWERFFFSQSFRTIFATAGWDLNVTFGAETIPLPDSLSDIDPTDCDNWDFDSRENLHDVMESVPGYDPDELDRVWRAHLVTVPAELGCSRGRMFDSGLVDGIDREGAATFSHDGYPSTDQCPAGTASAYGAAADERQHEHPRAFLRSAAHEVGHTFNQIHQSFEGGIDNSIMTVTPCVATVVDQAGGTFPDDIDLSFNATVRQHLIHLPDPAVRPGAMDFFGSAINAPEASDVNVIDGLSLEVEVDSDRIRLGEPLPVRWTLRNDGDRPVPVPGRLDTESLTARVSVTGPRGQTTFMRPVKLDPCSRVPIESLEPGSTEQGETVVFYGRDGFAFEEPGRYTVDVVILWELGGAQVAAEGSADVWVAYPLTDKDNQIASLMLDPEVGHATATRSTHKLDRASQRMQEVTALQKTHPVCKQLRRLGLV